MTLRMVVITDAHYDSSMFAPSFPYQICADRLMALAVEKVNQEIRPDLLLILGDLIDSSSNPHATTELQRMASILSTAELPVCIVSGNHDPKPHVFYQIFPHPPDWIEINGVRIMPFISGFLPEISRWRSNHEVGRLREARLGFSGPIVIAQHVPALAPQTRPREFLVENQAEAVAAMRRYGVVLAIGGHWHEGTDLIHADGVSGIAVPALHEEPFPFIEITLDGKSILAQHHKLGFAKELGIGSTKVARPGLNCVDKSPTMHQE